MSPDLSPLQQAEHVLRELRAELAAVREERDRLREYVVHKRECPLAPHVVWSTRKGCTCGLASLLPAPPKE